MQASSHNNTNNPADSGFYMPAEWSTHSCTWMAWPCREGLWSNQQATRQGYADVANAIARIEPVKMLTQARHTKDARHLLEENVEVIEIWKATLGGYYGSFTINGDTTPFCNEIRRIHLCTFKFQDSLTH